MIAAGLVTVRSWLSTLTAVSLLTWVREDRIWRPGMIAALAAGSFTVRVVSRAPQTAPSPSSTAVAESNRRLHANSTALARALRRISIDLVSGNSVANVAACVVCMHTPQEVQGATVTVKLAHAVLKHLALRMGDSEQRIELSWQSLVLLHGWTCGAEGCVVMV